MRRICLALIVTAAAASAGCTSNWGRHYDIVRGVRPTTAASGMEARLEPPNHWPEASNRFLGRILEVYSPDLLAVRSDDDGRIYRVKLAGAQVVSDPKNPGDNVGAAKQYISQNWLNREVVVEVPPRPERQIEGNQIWGHIVAEGKCLDALLIFQAYARQRDGSYPRRLQMRRAEEESVGDRGQFRPETDPTRPPMPVPLPSP